MLITTPEQLGMYLRDVRREKSKNQTEVGKMVGLKQTTVSKIERDPGSSTIDSLFRLLSSLNLELHLEDKARHHELEKHRDPDAW